MRLQHNDANFGIGTLAISDMPHAAEPAIAVDQLVKVYKTTRAVDGISFAIAPGSIVGLLGGNGAGKTTTIAMILGLVSPTSGSVQVLGCEFDLVDLLDRQTGKLSAGQKTRVSVAKALINRPDVLLLDEPTASLDPDTADWVRSHLERYRAE